MKEKEIDSEHKSEERQKAAKCIVCGRLVPLWIVSLAHADRRLADHVQSELLSDFFFLSFRCSFGQANGKAGNGDNAALEGL